MSVDLTSATGSFFSIMLTVFNWLSSIEFYIGPLHTNLFKLMISILAIEIIFFMLVMGVFDSD